MSDHTLDAAIALSPTGEHTSFGRTSPAYARQLDSSMIFDEILSMKRELGQARDLLRDAIGKLTTSFGNIDSLLGEIGEHEELKRKVDQEIGAVVTALQFQDMIDQLLNHTLGRLDAIERELGAGQTPGKTPGDVAGQQDQQPGKPVTQVHLDPGDIELF